MQFNPWSQVGGNVTLAATTASSRVALAAPASGFAALNARVLNDGAATMYIKFGDSTVVATVADTPVAPASERIFQYVADATHMAAIMRAGTGNADVALGLGA